MMRHQRGFSHVVILSLILICGCEQTVEPNGKITYNHVLLINETDPYYQIGFADYVFAGTVEEVVGQDLSASGDPVTILQITVTENLKGNLQEQIQVKYPGGYDSDGTLILYEGDELVDDGLPVVGETCLFVGIAQSDGSILLSALYADIAYSKESRELYTEYIENQEIVDRERFSSSYEE